MADGREDPTEPGTWTPLPLRGPAKDQPNQEDPYFEDPYYPDPYR
jgi:hypothetical protein